MSARTLPAAVLFSLAIASALAQQAAPRAPMFEVDAAWPTIPNNWLIGDVSSIAVDSHDRIWVLHRPRSLPEAQRAQSAPPVLEFDASGKLLASWGGPRETYEWPEREHGIFVDDKDFVWITGNGGWPQPSYTGSGDDMILKFTAAGGLVMQIGRRGKSTGNADTLNVHQAADTFVHAATNELFVADGYGNQRVVVFDADKGAFKRTWGAFGNKPAGTMAPNPSGPAPDQAAAESSPQFGLVHAVKVSKDGVVYVADRTNNRIQTFTVDGKYLKQVRLPMEGSVTPVPAGFAFSPDSRQQYLYVVDSGTMQVVIIDRARLTPIGRIGMRGPKPGEFNVVHHMAADSKGNLYTAEIAANHRAQRFVLK